MNGAHATDESHDKYAAGHENVIEGDIEEHAKGILAFIYAEWISFFDVFAGHIHVSVTQDQSHKLVIESGGEYADHHEDHEQDKSVLQVPTSSGHDQREFFPPESGKSSFFFLAISVDPEMEGGGESVQVLHRFAAGIEGTSVG